MHEQDDQRHHQRQRRHDRRYTEIGPPDLVGVANAERRQHVCRQGGPPPETK
jgi:hypothetical protein